MILTLDAGRERIAVRERLLAAAIAARQALEALESKIVAVDVLTDRSIGVSRTVRVLVTLDTRVELQIAVR